MCGVLWIMKTMTADKNNGIQWTQLDDLDFADDLALLSHNKQQMQTKTTELDTISAQAGLHIHKDKTRIMKINTTSNDPIVLRGDNPLQEVDTFTYLGSVISREGGTDEDVQARIQKARAAFVMLKKIWQSKEIKTQTKLRIFNSNVKSVLLYGSETWRSSSAVKRKLQTFVNRCLRRILHLHWTDKVSNRDLWERTGQEAVDTTIQGRKWRWLGHTLRKPATSITRQSLTWNPQGKRKRGRPRNTWRRSLEADLKRSGITWEEAARTAQDRESWRAVIDGLSSQGS